LGREENEEDDPGMNPSVEAAKPPPLRRFAAECESTSAVVVIDEACRDSRSLS